MRFMDTLLKGIEAQSIPAHSPIEQRWTASSSSRMSPAYGAPDGMHSWVGIINYLPPAENERAELQRQEITAFFKEKFCDWMNTVCEPVYAVPHWAKIERPSAAWKTLDMQRSLHAHYPLDFFKAAREELDPKGILGNLELNELLSKPPTAQP